MMQKPLILVVDDDQPILLLMKNVLREFGFESLTAANGADALRAAAEQPPELILLDMSMPEMPGTEFIRHLRRDPSLADIPVVILSGHPVSPLELEQIGAEGAIQKPFNLADLVERIRHHISTRSTRVSRT